MKQTTDPMCMWHCCQNARLPKGYYCASHAPIVERERVKPTPVFVWMPVLK